MAILDEGAVKLLDCPFCGGPAAVFKTTGSGLPVQLDPQKYIVGCEQLGCCEGGRPQRTEQGAISFWNARANLTAPTVPWPGRPFCEIAGRNANKLADRVRNKEDKEAAADAALAIKTLLTALSPAADIPSPGSGESDDTDRMRKISELIADLQDVHAKFGDTCVYIRRGGLSWGAIALNRRDDDKKNGVFDLQATHDKVMGELGAQVHRLRTDRDLWRSLYWKVAVKPGEPIPFDVERLLADTEPSPANTAETQAVEVGK